MAEKIIKLGTDGKLAQKVATVTSSGVSNAGEIVALDSNGKLSTTVMPDGIGADVVSIVASEALSADTLVNIYNDTGTAKARKADCSNGRRAMGYVKASYDSAATAIIYKEGTIVGSSLTIGEPVFLSTNGATTQTPVSTSGYLHQEMGVAMSATEIEFEPQTPITLA